MSEETQAQPSGFNWEKHFLPISILIAAVIISGSIFYTSGTGGTANIQQTPPVAKDVDTSETFEESDHALGNRDAKVKIVEFSDYQCPFCRSFWTNTLPQLKKSYLDTGKAVLIYRDYPLNFHPAALPSALAAECAGEQGKYWEFHDKLFSEQNKLELDKSRFTTISYTEDDIKRWAGETGLNMAQFGDCFASGKYQSEITTDQSEGSALGVSGTPGFFVNGRYVNGAQPFSVFQQLIEEELKK